MRSLMPFFLILLLTLFLLTGCVGLPPQTATDPPPHPTVTEAVPQPTVPAETTLPPQTESHSPLYIDGVTVSDVILYFNEVCLDAEFTTETVQSIGLVQKWDQPIYYYVFGAPTQEDLNAIAFMAQQLNTIENFPGLILAEDPATANLSIYLCGPEELTARMGNDFTTDDYGATTFWYTDDIITNGIICCRSDITQQERTSVILEELYNVLGPIQDSCLRTDSIIYQYSNDNTVLSAVDLLLLQLLYHPDIQCGMDAEACNAVIRNLYY